MTNKMPHEQPLFRIIVIFVFTVTAVSVTLLARAYFEVADKLMRYDRERAAVADVERFILQKYPSLDAATRRGHAEILVDATCGDIVDNVVACLDGSVVNPPPEVRVYARRAVEIHGL